MPARDPNTFPGFNVRLPTLAAQTKKGSKRPKTGLTQGGVGRRFAGAKTAATNGQFKPKKPK